MNGYKSTYYYINDWHNINTGDLCYYTVSWGRCAFGGEELYRCDTIDEAKAWVEAQIAAGKTTYKSIFGE